MTDHAAVTTITKRDGRRVPFERQRIEDAVWRAMCAVGDGSRAAAGVVCGQVVERLAANAADDEGGVYAPHVEDIQNTVEEALMGSGFTRTARCYILYRDTHARRRQEEGVVAMTGRHSTIHAPRSAAPPFHGPLNEFVYTRTYARWIPEKGRRELWSETVQRYMDHMAWALGEAKRPVPDHLTLDGLHRAILEHDVMPSMRLLMSAGPAARRDALVGYNCSFLAMSNIEDFSSVLLLLMAGCGVGFSVERQCVERLPVVETGDGHEGRDPVTWVVADSREGWAQALDRGIRCWYRGQDIEFDLGRLRPAGARLRTMGGRSSGPGPLRKMLDYARLTIRTRVGSRLRPIDVHGIVCKIGELTVAGGVRRSALISLSDLDDTDLRDAKAGAFWKTHPERSMANNSAVYTGRPSSDVLLREFAALAASGTGERGIFARTSVDPRRVATAPPGTVFGTNPCGEIVLRSRQLCNLSEVVCRHDDNLETLLRKVRVATILGTYQATLTHLNGMLPAEWRRNCEEERLLGVSLTGVTDCPLLTGDAGPETLRTLREAVWETNAEWSRWWGINPAAAATCVKPAGTTSLITNTSSGMHPRFAPYYVRRVRLSSTDALCHMLRAQGAPMHPEVGQSPDSATTWVVDFPVRAPRGARCQADLGAVAMCDLWASLKRNWTDHNPSVTVQVGVDEWIEVLAWLHRNWEVVGGLAFLPRDDHLYELAPFEATDEEGYRTLKGKWSGIDLACLQRFEHRDADEGDGAMMLVCTAASRDGCGGS